jgi:hypothetical protein
MSLHLFLFLLFSQPYAKERIFKPTTVLLSIIQCILQGHLEIRCCHSSQSGYLRIETGNPSALPHRAIWGTCWWREVPYFTAMEFFLLTILSVLLFLAVLELELRTSCLLGRHTTTWTTPLVFFFFFSILEIGSHQLLAWGWLRTWSSWLTRIIGMNHWCWALFSFFPSYKPVFSTSSSCPVFTLSYLCSIPSPPFYFSLLCCHHMKNFQLSIIVTKELRQSTYKEEVLIWAPGFSPWWLGPVERQYVLVGSTGWSKVLNDDSKCKKKKKELGPGKPSRAQLWWPKFLPLGPAS